MKLNGETERQPSFIRWPSFFWHVVPVLILALPAMQVSDFHNGALCIGY
jgi:hypothetical protein